MATTPILWSEGLHRPTKHHFVGWVVLRSFGVVEAYAPVFECSESGRRRTYGLIDGGPQDLFGIVGSAYIIHDEAEAAA